LNGYCNVSQSKWVLLEKNKKAICVDNKNYEQIAEFGNVGLQHTEITYNFTSAECVAFCSES